MMIDDQREEAQYKVLRATTLAEMCGDLAVAWDFQRDANVIPDKLLLLSELMKRDLEEASALLGNSMEVKKAQRLCQRKIKSTLTLVNQSGIIAK